MNPLERMRKERRWSLIFFNLLFLVVALIQWLSLYLQPPPTTAGYEEKADVVEFRE